VLISLASHDAGSVPPGISCDQLGRQRSVWIMAHVVVRVMSYDERLSSSLNRVSVHCLWESLMRHGRATLTAATLAVTVVGGAHAQATFGPSWVATSTHSSVLHPAHLLGTAAATTPCTWRWEPAVAEPSAIPRYSAHALGGSWLREPKTLTKAPRSDPSPGSRQLAVTREDDGWAVDRGASRVCRPV
jgi:hypothetical protein